jgi:hypothetical protein
MPPPRNATAADIAVWDETERAINGMPRPQSDSQFYAMFEAGQEVLAGPLPPQTIGPSETRPQAAIALPVVQIPETTRAAVSISTAACVTYDDDDIEELVLWDDVSPDGSSARRRETATPNGMSQMLDGAIEASAVKFDNYVDDDSDDAAAFAPCVTQSRPRSLLSAPKAVTDASMPVGAAEAGDVCEDAVEPFALDPDFDYDVPAAKLTRRFMPEPSVAEPMPAVREGAFGEVDELEELHAEAVAAAMNRIAIPAR